MHYQDKINHEYRHARINNGHRKACRVAVVAGHAHSLVTFRGPLLREMVRQGHRVTTTATEADSIVTQVLARDGITYAPTGLTRTGMNPFNDWQSIRDLRSWFRRAKPDVLISYTHKAVVYSALAVAGLGTRVFPVITGLGYAFIGSALKARIAKWVLRMLYRRASRHFTGVFFQNPDDARVFRQLGLLRPETPICIVRGSGIDTREFPFVPLRKIADIDSPADDRARIISIRFLLIARLLGDKGIREYVTAARIIRREHPNAEFQLIGPTDSNPSAISLSEVQEWVGEGIIVYHGAQVDVRPFLRDCMVYVLPSYREGTPRTVLEAMATGRAVITTDAPGCRETIFEASPADSEGVRQGRNGYLVPVKSVAALVAAMRRLIRDPMIAQIMGAAGRSLAEEHYDVHKVNRQMMEFMGLSPVSQNNE